MNRNRMIQIVSITVLLQLSGCGKAYLSSTFPETGGQHEVIAIVPIRTEITVHGKDPISVEQLDHLEEMEGRILQDQLFFGIDNKKERYDYSVDFLTPSDVNSVLQENDISTDELYSIKISELCNLLEVDGVMLGTASRTKPMSDGASVALGVASGLIGGIGIFGNSNEIEYTLEIYDGSTGNIIWSYKNNIKGSVDSTPYSMSENIGEHIAGIVPYRQ